MTKPWTKKDVKFMCGTIDAFWLTRRPLSDNQADLLLAAVRFEEALASKREEIVLAGIREARARHAERYVKNCQTIGNQLVRFTAYGQQDELIDRFVKLAHEEDDAERKLGTMLQRVLDEGLPQEVLDYAGPLNASSER